MSTTSKELDDKEITSTWQGSDDERLKMQKDAGRLTKFEMYKSPFRARMLDGIRKYNMKAKPLADRRISNVLIPLVRMVADSCITSMSAGNPSFNVRPRALTDYPKIDILKPAIDQVLEETNFDAVQNTFLTYGSVVGTAGLEVSTQVPQRLDENGNVCRDFSRPRIVIKPRSGMEMSFDPSMPNHQTKGATAWQEKISDDAFEEDYNIVRLMNGEKKYKNTEFVKGGVRMTLSASGVVTQRLAGMYDYKGIVLDHIQDPLRNHYRIYANNIPIYDIPLYSRRRRDGTHTMGDNALGDTRMCVWTNNDMFDDNDTTLALYGGGEAWLMDGLDKMYQDFGNMMVDNYALANTFALHFKPGTGVVGGLDLDSTDFYSGMFIQGEIVKTNFGEVQLRDYQVVKDIIDEWCVFVTGVNFKSLIGEQGATAFEVATKIRAANRRYEYKLKRLEDTVYKKLGKLVVAAIFTTYTVDDFEIVTGLDRDQLAEKFAEGNMAEDDLIFNDVPDTKGGSQRMITGIKHKTMIKIPGKVYTEKIGADKKRRYDNLGHDTLNEDVSKRGKADSFVPAAEEYLVTEEYSQKGALPDVVVDTGAMVAGRQQLELSDLQQLYQYAVGRKQMAVPDQTGKVNPLMDTEFDFQKFDKLHTDLLNFSPESVMKDSGDRAEDEREVDRIDETEALMKQAISEPPPPPMNAQASPQAAGPQSLSPGANGAEPAAAAGIGAGPPGLGAPGVPQANPLGALAG